MNTEQKCFYTIREFAAKLGVHRNTIHNAIKNGLISTLRLGGTKKSRYLIPYSEIDRMIALDLRKYKKED